MFIGHRPTRLHKPGSIMKYLPKQQGHAVDIGLGEHPQIEIAMFEEKAARHNVDVIRGERLPEVNLEAQYSQDFDTSRLN